MSTNEAALGVTPPISLALPTEAENKANSELVEELRNQNSFEPSSSTEKRYVTGIYRVSGGALSLTGMSPTRHKVLTSLQVICDEFVRRIAAEKEPGNEQLIKDARGKILTFGSFRLGVYGPDSDIDTLVVTPKYVTREDYFNLFPELLLSMAPEGAITDLAVVKDAFVPLIELKFSGISIDLTFSRIAVYKQIPKDFSLADSSLLRGLDEAELRSVNGARVTDEVLALVPEESTFKLALRAIKLWAQRRAIYGNKMGFPGGIAWVLMVARVCQLYPKAASANIVFKFFNIIRRWPWPQPVLLKRVEGGPLQVRVWNPKVGVSKVC